MKKYLPILVIAIIAVFAAIGIREYMKEKKVVAEPNKGEVLINVPSTPKGKPSEADPVPVIKDSPIDDNKDKEKPEKEPTIPAKEPEPTEVPVTPEPTEVPAVTEVPVTPEPTEVPTVTEVPVIPEPNEVPEEPVVHNPKVSVKNVKAPEEITEGSSFGIKGTISVDDGVLTKVTGKVTSEDGKKTYFSKSVKPNKAKYSLAGNKIDKAMTFGTLKPGTYVYTITVETTYTEAKVVIEQKFTVKAKPVKVTPTPTPTPVPPTPTPTPTPEPPKTEQHWILEGLSEVSEEFERACYEVCNELVEYALSIGISEETVVYKKTSPTSWIVKFIFKKDNNFLGFTPKKQYLLAQFTKNGDVSRGDEFFWSMEDAKKLILQFKDFK